MDSGKATLDGEDKKTPNGPTETQIPEKKSTYTFNRLKDLQALLKKESALKELCKK